MRFVMDCGRCLVVAGFFFGCLGALAAAESAPRADVVFILADDPGERNNLAEQQPAKAAELWARYECLAREAAPPKNQE